jgi:tetratricopeptide (TPR) repeat protein
MPRVLFNMGDAFYNIKEYDSARVYYQGVIEQFSASPLAADALTGLQFTYQAQGKSTEALSTIEKYLGAKPSGISTEELILKKGDLLFGQNDYAGALHEYQRVLSLNPTRTVKAKTIHQLGRAYELQGDPQHAIASYEQIVSEFSETEDAPPAALALAIEYCKHKQYGAAVKMLEGFDRRFPDSPLAEEARYNLGLALNGDGRADEATGQFQSIIRQYPNDVFADRSRLAVARFHGIRKEYQAALDSLNIVVGHRGDDIAAEALVTIGDIYLSMKRYKDALQALNDVVAQYKDFPLFVERARLETGLCYERLHDPANARRAYQEIVKTPVDPDVKTEAQKRLKRLRR